MPSGVGAGWSRGSGGPWRSWVLRIYGSTVKLQFWNPKTVEGGNDGGVTYGGSYPTSLTTHYTKGHTRTRNSMSRRFHTGTGAGELDR